MSASFGNASYSPAARPRLTPGIPLGGIAALAVTLAVMAGSMIWDEASGDGGVRVRTHVSIDGGLPPVRPLPPLPPIAPVAPIAPGAPLPPGLMVDEAEIARTVEEALRGVDWAEIERQVQEATRDLDVAALSREARRAAEAARIEAHRLREQAATLRDRTAPTPADIAADQSGGALAANFDARALRLVNLHGDVVIEVTRRDTVRLEVAENASALRTSVVDGRLTVVGSGEGGRAVDMRILVPAGADLDLVGVIGDIAIDGRGLGALALDLIRGSVSAPEVASATIKVHQAGDVALDEVKGALRYAVFGAGDLSVARAGEAFVEVSGSADVALTRVGALTLSIPGRADIAVDRVDGPVNAAFMGAGSVTIADGRADPLRVAVTGTGEFHFDGTAHDPVVLADGNGRVHVARHTGKASVQNRGQGTAWVGD